MDTSIIYDALIIGYEGPALEFALSFTEKAYRYLIIDSNRQTVEKLKAKSLPVKYTDFNNLDFIQNIEVEALKDIVISVKEIDLVLLLIRTIRQFNDHIVLIVLVEDMTNSEELYSSGATNVICYPNIGITQVLDFISQNGFDKAKFEAEKKKHIEYLRKLKEFSL